MSAPASPLIRPAIQEEHPSDEGLGLSALLSLLPAGAYVHDDVAPAGMRELVRDLSLRAAAWGAGPRGAWRAW